jgi:hypothetical protein
MACTPGSAAERSALHTPIARRRPASMNGLAASSVLTWNVQGIDARHFLQHLDGQVGRVAGRGSCSKLPRLRLGERDEFPDVLHRQRGMHHQHGGGAAELADHGEVLDRIEGNLLVERRIDRMRRGRDHHRVAVGCRAGNEFGADHGRAARAVFDDDLLTEVLAEFGGKQPRQDVSAAPGRRGHDDAHRL